MGHKAKRCAATAKNGSREEKKVTAPAAAGGASSSDGEEDGGTAPTRLPMTNLVRLMRQAIPKNAKISSRAKDLTHNCALEFVGFLAGEAVEQAPAQHRRTIAPEDFTSSFQTLGFDDYVKPMTTYISRYRDQANAAGYRAGSFARRRPPPPPATTAAAAVTAPPGISDEETQRRRVPPHGENDA